MANYTNLLKDPRWQKKRLEIMDRDSFTCTMCGDTKETLNVHHKDYENKKFPWDVSNENLITVCETCHQIIEGCKKSGFIVFSTAKNDDQLLAFGVFKNEKCIAIANMDDQSSSSYSIDTLEKWVEKLKKITV